MSGAVGNSNNNIPLYIGASSIISHNISLFTTGDFIFSSGITLYTPGSIQTWPPITLYTLNVGSGSVSPASLPFYTAGLIHPTSTLYFPLYTSASTAGTNGLYNDTDLYLEGGKLYQSLPLYLGVAAIPYPPSGNMSLFVGTPHITGVYNNSINLYLDNNVSGIISIVKRLFISGLGGLAGGSISTSNLLPLFIDVSGISSSSSNTSKTISLMTESNTKSSGNIPLYIGASSIQSNHLSIYEAGFIFYPSGINFYTTGRTLDFMNL